MMVHPNLSLIVVRTYSYIRQSRLLIETSKALIDRSQKIIDDVTAKKFEQAFLKREAKQSPRRN